MLSESITYYNPNRCKNDGTRIKPAFKVRIIYQFHQTKTFHKPCENAYLFPNNQIPRQNDSLFLTTLADYAVLVYK